MWLGFISGHVRTHSSSTVPGGYQDLSLWGSAKYGFYSPKQGLCFPGSQLIRIFTKLAASVSLHAHTLSEGAHSFDTLLVPLLVN